MRREVVKTERVTADAVVIAAGVGTAALIEEGVGVTLPLRKSYNQYPRLEASPQLTLTEGRVALPVVEHLGFSLRTQGEGVLVVPPPLPPDPEGYQPRGGQLVGVRVGLRRELLEELMERLESMPFLAWETLNLGKTASGVRGAWDVHTPSGLPEFFEVRPGLYALAGGREGLTLGLAAALDLAGKVANQPERPWQ
jgi:glycine/D-amino acid oxidase-like deaminating enzyme